MRSILDALLATSPGRLIAILAFAMTLESLLFVVGFDILLPIAGAIVGTNLQQDTLHISGSGIDEIRIIYSRLLAYAFTLIVLALGLKIVLRRESAEEADKVECPYCLSAIPFEATRCAFCGSDVAPLVSEDSAPV